MNLEKIIDVQYPIIQGGMANIATAEFAAAVSNVGALGTIGSGGVNAEGLKQAIERFRTLSDKPFAVNLMLMHPEAEQMAQIIADYEVPIVTTGAGNPGKYVDLWKQKGLKVIPVVPNPSLAKRMESYGVDAVIAEGTEAGGHIGEMTTMTLIPQVKAEVKIPVIAAGGIASGEQMLAAEVLGASGIQVGTCLLVAEECPIHENYKEALIKAKDTNITVTGRIGGTPVRLIRNQMSRNYITKEKAGWGKEELEVFTLGAMRRAVFQGDTKEGSMMAGLVVAQLKEILPLKTIIEDLYNGYIQAKKRVGEEI